MKWREVGVIWRGVIWLWRNAIDMPPVWLALFMAAIWVQTAVFNPAGFDSGAAGVAGWAAIGAGVALTAAAFFEFRRARTTVVPRKTPDAMITTGPYRWSRNPIYLADAMVLFGFALIMGSPLGLVSVPLFMWLIAARFIRGEEVVLCQTLGSAYAAYCRRVARWL